MMSFRSRAALAAIGLVVAVGGGWLGMRWYKASKVAEFLPIGEAFLARVEARDVATLKRLGLDSAGIAGALALPPEQVRAILKGRLRVATGQIDNDFALITFDTDATFCPANAGHAGRLDMQFIRQGGQWMVERADPAIC
jgi:hypothetical protein